MFKDGIGLSWLGPYQPFGERSLLPSFAISWGRGLLRSRGFVIYLGRHETHKKTQEKVNAKT